MAQSPDPEIEFRQEDDDQIEIGHGDIFVEEKDIFVEEKDVSYDSFGEIHKNENGGDEMEYEARHTARGPRNSRACSVFRIKPEPCSGNEDWEEYISQFEIYADLWNLKESEKAKCKGTEKLEAVTSVGRELMGKERHSEEKNRSDIYETCIHHRSTSTTLPYDKSLTMGDDKKPSLEQTHLKFLDVNDNQLRSCYDTQGPELTQCNAAYSEKSEPATDKMPEHLQDVWERSSVHLRNEERRRLASLLIKYQYIFSKSSDDHGRTDLVKHRVNTPSNCAWSISIVLVIMKNSSTRFCVGYRRLIDVTVKDAYPELMSVLMPFQRIADTKYDDFGTRSCHATTSSNCTAQEHRYTYGIRRLCV
ncbi:hypothetical protein CHS0354_001363 [Potamilus streckersoni]|uniref:Uncharacterized protein n=1 Tax=Potamilus streckersoni TaxID=2493646 RepID=A0AAE0TFJ9_9BIVA|nr:hypothetical protein CHS0354_001363 [Potamilus streckersoni]